jgi:hypothetical protein
MALSSKISTIYIRKAGGSDWSYTITTNNFTSEIGQVNYGSAYDEAIDASLRHNLRGFRLTVTLNWAKLLSSTFDGNVSADGDTASSFLNDLVSALVTDGDSYVQVSFDNSNWINVVPDGATVTTAYTNQIGRGSSNITLIGQQILTSIPAYLEAPSV